MDERYIAKITCTSEKSSMSRKGILWHFRCSFSVFSFLEYPSSNVYSVRELELFDFNFPAQTEAIERASQRGEDKSGEEYRIVWYIVDQVQINLFCPPSENEIFY